MRQHEYRKKRRGSSRSAEYHCKTCDFYGTPVTQEEKQEIAEKLLCERVPQCGIARAAHVSHNRLISHIEKKKSDLSDRMEYGLLPDRSSSEYGSGQHLTAIHCGQPAQLPGSGK